MHFDLLLLNGTLVTSQATTLCDIGIVNGKIEAVGDLKQATSIEIIDCKGLHILPGFIDTQVHFREPGLTHKEDLESGTRAAIFGGVTTIFEMPNTDPCTITKEALQHKLDVCKDRAWCDFSFFIGASAENVDHLAQLEMLPGTPGVKIFMGSSTGPLLVESDELLKKVLENGKMPCPIHAEDEPRLRKRKSLATSSPQTHPIWRDAEAARLATERIIRLSDETGRPVHVLHISTLDELPLLQNAKNKKSRVTCEITPQHLTLHAPEAYEQLGTYAQMNPPIRSKEHTDALWKAVQSGLFDLIGSDHAPHTIEEKSKPYPSSPSGMPGVQTILPIMLNWVHQGKISINQLVNMTSLRPAQLYGIKNKGKIDKGYDADFVLVDLDSDFEITTDWLQSKCAWSPYTGWKTKGKPILTILRGKIIVRDSELQTKATGEAVNFDWK